jgi:hypothetical protein
MRLVIVSRNHAIVLAVERNKYVTDGRHGSVLGFWWLHLMTSPTSSAWATSGHVIAASAALKVCGVSFQGSTQTSRKVTVHHSTRRLADFPRLLDYLHAAMGSIGVSMMMRDAGLTSRFLKHRISQVSCASIYPIIRASLD